MKSKLLYGLLFLTLACSEKAAELPILSYNYVDGKKEVYKISDFKFVNQDGDTITSSATEGTVHTMNFFFTTCPSICPPMRIKQQELSEIFSEEKQFKQFSISIDFEKDNIEQLAYYSKIHHINTSQWQLLRATSEAQLQAIAQQLKTNFRPNEDGTDFYHSSYVALIDKQQYIRGFYNILLESDLHLLEADIRRLLD
ncbi:SCO family protein [Psychroserpens sp. SPM9]|uniref:SCO family protein n=1 Tax=Psychroserpens sp. SPM9 TaxID=2975598 RepID=UPI0021A79E11|nr:SCO family protein [Psychroserpens sp. SPM9]MDG5493042.1 SCO family protein [Psychroserpens sp. SPM9]